MGKRELTISPSLICADLCNLEREIKEFERLGVQSLHIDLIDSHFSPSLPLGLTAIAQLRKKTDMDFDVHVMATNNEFFIQELTKIGVQSITFHYESTIHAERMLQSINSAGMKAGIALNPATPLPVLTYLADRCAYVLLMLISPGYAGHAGEKMVPYALEKIEQCRAYLGENSAQKIVVDGRVSMEAIPSLVEAGADVLVAGSTSFFKTGNSLEQNIQIMREKISLGLRREEEK